MLFSLDADNVRRVDVRRIFVGWIFDRLLIDSQQVFDLFGIDVRRMDYRCSIDVRWKCPSFPPSFFRSSFLFFFVRCISYAPFVHLWCIDLTFDSLDERPLRESSRGTSRHFEASNVYRKCIESLYKVYRISIESLSNLYRISIGIPLRNVVKRETDVC